MANEPQTRIYGLDFTSAPSRTKPLTLAHCVLEGQCLQALQVEKLSTFSEFEQALAAPGPWVMGIDFPFGQPRELLKNLDWPTEWSAYVAVVENMGKETYENTFRSYGRRLFRHTDSVSRSRSPMQLDFIPVGKMFFQGAPRLLRSGATVIPCHRGDPQRIVLEAYPKLVAKALAGHNPYKSDNRSKQTAAHRKTREHIVQQLGNTAAVYGVWVEWADGLDAGVVDDPTGDVIDAVLCALQAAWGSQRSGSGYGVPQECDRAEGWIIDPANE